MVSPSEIERRYAAVREAMHAHGLDAVVVCGSEYTGFEGAVTYLSGFAIVHRYAYVVLPRDGEPSIVFPAEARYVGVHGTSWIEDQVFAERPGEWLGDRLNGKRVGVYGLDYVLTVRDFVALSHKVDVVPFDVEFDLARAVKSDEEVESVRDSVRINTQGFHLFADGGHWVEVSRSLGTPNAEVSRMLDAYEEYFEAAKSALRPGATAHDAHRAVSKGFTDRGYHLGHVTGHSIGMTMIEHPRIGEGIETELTANMVFSMHPHAIAADGRECLYMQDTWLVSEDGGVPLAGLEMRIW